MINPAHEFVVIYNTFWAGHCVAGTISVHLTTHKLHRSPIVQGKEILTTRTDYVNSYPSILQTTCYYFTATETTAEVCAGVVRCWSV